VDELLSLVHGSSVRRGESMLSLIEELYPICRSITGNGVRRTLDAIERLLPLERHEVPSGTAVFDWTVPQEWNIEDAYVARETGERVIDFRESNLHVVSYSTPVNRTVTLEELRRHLHTDPEHPSWIPYRTAYYEQDWGFCLRHRDLSRFSDERYEVVIDSVLEDGSLTYGELFLKGEDPREVLLSTHVCHPSLCNDNLSGIVVLTQLAQAIAQSAHRRYSYRILFIPGTIGAIVWLARNRATARAVVHGLVVAGVGDRGPVHYKRSRRGDAEIDQVVTRVLKEEGGPDRTMEFSPYGYDERQFCSPGFDLPVGRFSRSEWGTYPEYHTSGDDLAFVTADSLTDSLAKLAKSVWMLETNRTFASANPWCEPQLGRRGLYGSSESGEERTAILWTLNLSDGRHSLVDIAERSGLPYEAVWRACRKLETAGLLLQSGA
jgi:aminopeptidase-like protein